MTDLAKTSEGQTLADLAAVREVLATVENTWKLKRAESRELTLRLITEYGYSVAKASELSGHHRQTISVWLKIHNAGRK